MRIIFSELSPEYGHYTFPHAVYAVAEDRSEIPEIYNRGFLPYSADTDIQTPVFYLARSLRVCLQSFKDSSENRRVDRKMEIEETQIRLIAQSDYPIDDPQFLSFCRRYIDERFPSGAMPEERFQYILRHQLTTHFLEFKDAAGDLLGIIVASMHGGMMHYWYAFFNNTYRENAPIGKWIMWKSIRWAQDQGLKQIYLGTCYGTKSLYKVRDFKGVEFFNGEQWDRDVKELKRRVKEDDGHFKVDRWRRDGLLPQ